jgi:hypothetical protein
MVATIFQENIMRRQALVGLAFAVACGVGTWAWAQAQQQPGKLLDGFSGKRVFVAAKDGIDTVMHNASLRQLGGRLFLVGVGDGGTGAYGDAPVWIPLDSVTRMADLDAKAQEK